MSTVNTELHSDKLHNTPKRQEILKQLKRRPKVSTNLGALVCIVLLVLILPFFAPQNPYDLNQLDIMDGLLAPLSESLNGTMYLLGTDDQGRDMLSAILYGLRISMLVGLSTVIISALLGSTVGLIAAYVGGRVDAFLMRVVDFVLGFPTILVALVLLAVMGRGVDKVILALVMVQWAHYARLMRGRTLQERKKEYIEAAKNLGYKPLRILFVHLFPNCIGPVMVFGTVQIANAIILEATLSFLGVGVPITEPSLGLLISNGYQYLLSGQYWISVFPGVALLILIMGINIIGDRLRLAMDSRSI